MLLKVTILGEQEHSVQSADRIKVVQVRHWGDMNLPKPGKFTASISENNMDFILE